MNFNQILADTDFINYYYNILKNRGCILPDDMETFKNRLWVDTGAVCAAYNNYLYGGI